MDLAAQILRDLPEAANVEVPGDRWVRPLSHGQRQVRNHCVIFWSPKSCRLPTASMWRRFSNESCQRFGHTR